MKQDNLLLVITVGGLSLMLIIIRIGFYMQFVLKMGCG